MILTPILTVDIPCLTLKQEAYLHELLKKDSHAAVAKECGYSATNSKTYIVALGKKFKTHGRMGLILKAARDGLRYKTELGAHKLFRISIEHQVIQSLKNED